MAKCSLCTNFNGVFKFKDHMGFISICKWCRDKMDSFLKEIKDKKIERMDEIRMLAGYKFGWYYNNAMRIIERKFEI